MLTINIYDRYWSFRLNICIIALSFRLRIFNSFVKCLLQVNSLNYEPWNTKVFILSASELQSGMAPAQHPETTEVFTWLQA